MLRTPQSSCKCPVLLLVTGRGCCMPVLLLLVQWAQLCLTVLKDILRQTNTECAWPHCGQQQATFCFLDEEPLTKETAVIYLEDFLINTFIIMELNRESLQKGHSQLDWKICVKGKINSSIACTVIIWNLLLCWWHHLNTIEVNYILGFPLFITDMTCCLKDNHNLNDQKVYW